MTGIPVNLIIYAVLALGVGGYVLHCEHAKDDRQSIIDTLRLEKKIAVRIKEIQEAKDLTNKRTADDEVTRLTANNKRIAAELRNLRRSTSFLPPASPTAKHPDRITLQRTELQRTLEYLDERGAGIAEEGDSQRIGLDSVKRWGGRR